MVVVHTVASVDPADGGPSRSVPALVGALESVDVDTRLHVWDLDGRLETLGVDLVHDHGLWLPSNHAVAVAVRGAALPRVLSPRGMLEPWALAYRRWKKRAAWLLYQRRDLRSAAIVHVTSEAEAESVRQAGLRNPLALIPNGTILPADLPQKTRDGLNRALFLSRVHRKKGLPLLVDAWAATKPEGWELVIAGPNEGGHRAEVEAQAAWLGLNGSVHFIGPVDDTAKWELYRSADLFVLPTHSENFGLVVAEALAAGVPVLTTKGAPWQALQTERCGWWTDVSAEAIATALGEAVALSDEQRRAMGERGRLYVQENLSWDRVARQMSAVYSWILGRDDRPNCVDEWTAIHPFR